ncbi:uncharacterized protein LOC129001766 [Macrosteles quadrilineatus]|uniref:uncharacterized protein LOC129001766 n=1 Tax=Macrosteles quadrilineatus TaxID=74068 RepID=UPI0023E2935E|nr:uncharacterized protein LOC129001766 [Macrosteles quadrilineatus]
MRRSEDLELPQAIDTYSCELNGNGGNQPYELVMQKVLMPGSKHYTRLLLKFKDGEKEHDIPLANYSDFEKYTLPINDVELAEIFASEIHLYVVSGSTPTNVEVIVQGVMIDQKSRSPVGRRHKIAFAKRDNAATIEITSTTNENIGGSRFLEEEKRRHWIRIEELCSKKK